MLETIGGRRRGGYDSKIAARLPAIGERLANDTRKTTHCDQAVGHEHTLNVLFALLARAERGRGRILTIAIATSVYSEARQTRRKGEMRPHAVNRAAIEPPLLQAAEPLIAWD